MPKANNSFKEKLAKLEQIVAWFEDDNVDLDQALTKYEEGIKLAKELEKHLVSVKNKIDKIEIDSK